MSKDSKDEASKQRIPATQLLFKFLEENKLDLKIKQQKIRFVEDNGILIDPPSLVIYYKDEVKRGR